MSEEEGSLAANLTKRRMTVDNSESMQIKGVMMRQKLDCLNNDNSCC